MKRTLILVTAVYIASLVAGCGGKKSANQSNNPSAQDTGRQADINAINAVEAKLKTLTSLDVYNANLAITAYTQFSSHYPNDSLAPVYLFKAASMASSSGQFQRAIGFYDNVCAKYPNFKQMPYCIFGEGFIYDNYLKDTTKAHAKYQQVIDKFPDNVWASQAKSAIADLGKTNEEIMKGFEEKNKKAKN